MFKTATIWNICQDTHRRYRFTGEAERFVCRLRLKREQTKKIRGSNATCHLYIFSNFYKLSIHLCLDLVLDQIARLMPITAPIHITNANPSI